MSAWTESAAAGGLWKELPPGYQIAYGMKIDVAQGASLAPYAAPQEGAPPAGREDDQEHAHAL